MLTASDVVKIKVVVVVISTVVMLWGATEFWASMFNVAGAWNFRDVKIWALYSPYYQVTALVIVGIAGLLLWRWLTPPAKH